MYEALRQFETSGEQGWFGPCSATSQLAVTLELLLIELSFVEVRCFQSRKHLACFPKLEGNYHDVNAD